MEKTSDFRRKPTSVYEERRLYGNRGAKQLLLFLINPKNWLVFAITLWVGTTILYELYSPYELYEETEVTK